MKSFIERLEELKCYKPFTDHQKGFTDGIFNAIRIYNELHPSTENVQPEPNKQHTEGSFKVRVTNSRDWYSEKDTWYVKIYDEKFYVTVPEVGCQEGGERILKSDCEIIPDDWDELRNKGLDNKLSEKIDFTETTIIPFDYKRWKDGDFLRVVTREGKEVTQLTEFKVCNDGESLSGVIDGELTTLYKNGQLFMGGITGDDLHLEIAKPKAKQVTTYHYIESTGYVRGSSMSKHELVNLIGETTTEQQENGEWKIVKTTLK